MYKLAIKLAVFTFAIVGAASLFSGGSAAADLCPNISRVGNQIPAGYGYNNGEQLDGFGGLVVASSVGTMTNGQPDNQGRTGHPIDAKYNLNSFVPDAPPGQEYHLGGHPKDERIFTVDSSNQTTNRTSQRWFGTNGSVGDALYAGNGGGFTCPGWDSIGPGQAGEIGNRHALDCGEAYYPIGNPSQKTSFTPTRFWISDLPSPNGESGQWEVQVFGMNASYSFNFSPGLMGPGDFSKYFTIQNGQTVRINLIWHAQPPPPPDLQSECNHLDITDGGGWTNPANGNVFGSNDVRTKVRVEDSGGHALVHPANDNPSRYFYLNNERRIWDYTPLGRQVNITVIREYYHNTGTKDANGNWIYAWDAFEDDSRTHTCYANNCSISAAGNVAGKPQGVKAGSQVAVTITIVNWANTGAEPGGLNLPSNLGGYDFWFDSDGGQTGGLQSLNVRLPTIGRYDPSIPNNNVFQTTVTINAPNAVGHYHFSGSPVYRGLMYPEDSNCGYDIDVYQQFGAGLSASTSLSPTDENPNSVNYNTTVSLSPSSPPVYIPTYSKFYKKFAPPSGAETTLADHSGGIYPNEAVWSGNYAIPPGSFSAGDQYCAAVHANYTSGWIGPNGPYDVAEPGPGGDSLPGCQKVTNKPFFKAYNSTISARNGISDPSGTCSATAANSGLLAGWNDNLDGPGNDRGSGTQLSALALIKITGVASAQTDITRSPTDLTFANTNSADITSSRESPSLGGNFGGTPTCTAPPTPKLGALNLAGNPAPLPASGNYQHTGNLKISGGNISGSTAIFVKGDVYLNGNITYNTAGWSPGSVPSLVIVATGNIYVDPGVTQLDGVFISQPSSPAAGGTVYTCATAINPTTFKVNSDFTACHNQLLVNGSLTGNKIKLLRTFGSLRDDTPTPGTPGGSQLGLQYSSCGSYGNPSGGEPCLPASGTSGLKCIHLNEPSESPAGIWDDNILCLPITSPTSLYWTHWDNSPYSNRRDGAVRGDPGVLNLAGVKALGYTHCTKFDVPADYAQTWYDNWLCSNTDSGLNFQLNNDSTQYCTPIVEIADREGWTLPGHFLCEPKAPDAIPPHSGPFTSCSNAGIQMTTDTCAAEVFRFSPELYLTDPPTQPANKGATQYDAITSLPPVL